MPRFSAADEAAVTAYLNAFLGDTICPRQIWYEGLGGHGVPGQEDLDAICGVINGLSDWKPVGSVRYEKFGEQPSYKRTEDNQPKSVAGKTMPQHMFKLNGLYKAPDGKVLKVVLAEVYNLRCFEVKDGSMIGPMIKIHPTSDYAKSLQEVL